MVRWKLNFVIFGLNWMTRPSASTVKGFVLNGFVQWKEMRDRARCSSCWLLREPPQNQREHPDNRARWSLLTTKYQLEKPRKETFRLFQLRFVPNESNYFSVSVDFAASPLVISSRFPLKKAWLLPFYTRHSHKYGEPPCGAPTAAADQQTWFPQSPSTTERWCQSWGWEPGRSDSTFHSKTSLRAGQAWYMFKWSSRLAPATILSCSVFRHGYHGYHYPQWSSCNGPLGKKFCD